MKAGIDKSAAQIAYDQAIIDAKAIKVTADALAYKKKANIAADNALQAKLDTELAIQTVWANAFKTRQVPLIQGGSGGEGGSGNSEVSNFMNLMSADLAKKLHYERGVALKKP